MPTKSNPLFNRTFMKGDSVTWRSQAGGAWTEKTGVVIEVVPPLTRPLNRFTQSIREHESYVVLVPRTTMVKSNNSPVKANATAKRVLKLETYWPIRSKLKPSRKNVAIPPDFQIKTAPTDINTSPTTSDNGASAANANGASTANANDASTANANDASTKSTGEVTDGTPNVHKQPGGIDHDTSASSDMRTDIAHDAPESRAMPTDDADHHGEIDRPRCSC